MLSKEDVIAYCLSLPAVYEDYPFDEVTAVMRHKGNKKSFALIIFAHGKQHINLKCEPDRAEFLRRIYAGVTAGYHMNKMHWNSVFADSDVPEEEIKSMIDHSYMLTRPKLKKRRKKK